MLVDTYLTVLTGQLPADDKLDSPQSSSAIFGSVGRMATAIQQQDDSHRIAIYPCVGAGEAGSGLLLALGYLLSQATSVVLYPTILRVSEDDRLSDDSFTPDEWVLDDLDDDTAIWGELAHGEGGWALKIYVENDASEGELTVLERQAGNWADLLKFAPVLAKEIADKLGLEFRLTFPDIANLEAQACEALCVSLFAATRDVLMTAIEGKQTDSWLSAVNQLIDAANTLEEGSITAITGAALGYSALLGDRFELFGEIPVYHNHPQQVKKWQDGSASFALVILESGLASTALLTWCLEQLEVVVTEHPSVTANWVILSLFYSQMQRPDLSVDVCQRAIESGIQESLIYFNYVDALSEVIENGLRIERVLLSGELVSEQSLNAERILSLEQGVKASSKPSTSRLAQWVLETAKQADLSQAEQIFQRLVALDVKGHEVDSVIQQLSYLEDLEWMIAPLEQAAGQGGFTPLLNLARALLLTGDSAGCKTTTKKALLAAKEHHQRAEGQMLLIEAETPSVQADLADIVSKIQRKGGEIYEGDLEFLEYLVENAPDYAEGYLVLAAAYRRLDEPNTALEVLLDAEKVTGGTPEIYLSLAELFEQEDELTLAIENVRKGLDLAPMSVALMAQAALLAYLSGDDDGAQAFLRRAHGITPYHPRIVAVTKRMQQDSSDDDDE